MDRKSALHTELIKMDKIEMGGFQGMAEEDILKMKEKMSTYHETLAKESSRRCVECSVSWMERRTPELSS